MIDIGNLLGGLKAGASGFSNLLQNPQVKDLVSSTSEDLLPGILGQEDEDQDKILKLIQGMQPQSVNIPQFTSPLSGLIGGQ